MKLAETVKGSLAEWSPAGAGPHSWSRALTGSGWSLGLTADKVESLGCALRELTLVGDGDADVAGWAGRLAGKVTGLMEPLAVHEVDAGRGEALLRSASPADRDGRPAYYEVALTGGGRLSLRRYHGSAGTGSRREQVAFALTHEAIGKFVEDAAAAAG